MTGPQTQPEPSAQPAPRELDIFGFVLLLLRNLRTILGFGAVFFLVMLVAMLRAKPRYASTAVMIVPQGNVTSAKLAQELAVSTADLLGGGYELYGDMLKSRVVSDHLIDDYHLISVYGTRDRADAETVLAARTKVETEREGLIRVTVQDTDAQRAADLANDYLRQLDDLNSHLVLTSVGEERAYLEREMVREKDRLADAEVELKKVEESTTGVTPEAQATVGLTALETTRAQLRADEIRRAALLTGETEENPDIQRLNSEIASLTGQVNALEHGAPGVSNGTPIASVPEQALEYVRRKRDVTFHETLFDLLEKEFEEAKEQEAKNPSIVEILDPAIPSHHKAWPPRTVYCGLAAIVGLVAGVFYVGLLALARAYAANPQNAENLRQLKKFYRRH